MTPLDSPVTPVPVNQGSVRFSETVSLDTDSPNWSRAIKHQEPFLPDHSPHCSHIRALFQFITQPARVRGTFDCGRRARLSMTPPRLLVTSSGMGADGSSTARVQRGPSKAARRASTEDLQAPSPPPHRAFDFAFPALLESRHGFVLRTSPPPYPIQPPRWRKSNRAAHPADQIV